MIYYLGFATLGGYAVRERGINNTDSSLNHERQVLGRGASNKPLTCCSVRHTQGFVRALQPAECPLVLEALRAGSAGSSVFQEATAQGGDAVPLLPVGT